MSFLINKTSFMSKYVVYLKNDMVVYVEGDEVEGFLLDIKNNNTQFIQSKGCFFNKSIIERVIHID